MASPERWIFAQKHSAKMMLQAGVFMALAGLFELLIDLPESASAICGLTILVITTIVMIAATEKALKKEFGKI